MTWEEKIEEFKQLRAALPEFIENMSLLLPAEALRDVRSRQQERGQNAQGNDHKPYTPAYLKQKQKAGKYTGKVDLTYSTRMWNNTGVVGRETNTDGFRVEIAGRSEETQVKLDANSERYGDVLEMSSDEIDNLATRFDEELADFTALYVTPDQG